jgi:prepilin-type N-terminal cleavage/methylation domain-containing protein
MKKLLPHNSSEGFTLMSIRSAQALKVNSKGFTLIELLIAITIIAILATVGFVAFQGITQKARDDKRIADLNSIRNAKESYYTSGAYLALLDSQFNSGSVPTDPTGGSNCGTDSNKICGYCSVAAKGEPTSGTCTAVTNGTPGAGASYIVCANLENTVNGLKYYCVSNAQ